MSEFSFVVGVTGHRDLAPGSLDATRDVVKATLGSLKDQLGRAELQIDCGMSSGADQLVAEVAIELGIPVHAQGQEHGRVTTIEECMGCGRCVVSCPADALAFHDVRNSLRPELVQNGSKLHGRTPRRAGVEGDNKKGAA